MTDRTHDIARATLLASFLVSALALPQFAQAKDRSALYSAAQPYRALNLFEVAPAQEGGAAMEVYAQPGASGMGYFCGAGEFALNVLNVPPATRLVISRAEAPSTTRPGFKSVLFDMVPAAQADTVPASGPFLNPDRVGENRSASASRSFCKPPGRQRRND